MPSIAKPSTILTTRLAAVRLSEPCCVSATAASSSLELAESTRTAPHSGQNLPDSFTDTEQARQALIENCDALGSEGSSRRAACGGRTMFHTGTVDCIF